MNKQSTFRSRSPLRISFAGGGTDVSPFSDKFGGIVLNSTIDLYAHAIIKTNKENCIIFNSVDNDIKIKFAKSLKLRQRKSLRLHIAIYNKIIEKFNIKKPKGFELTTYCDAPPGSGLGSSSALLVSIIKVFLDLFKLNLNNQNIALLAYQVERIELALAGGKQDQYASAFGGFNLIEFNKNGTVQVNKLKLNKWIINELEESTVLYFTGQSRDSSSIIEHQIKSISDGNLDVVSAKKKIKKQAIQMKQAISKGDFGKYSRLLSSGWTEKKKLSSKITNKKLEKIYNYAIKNGAQSGKISGAGGGGFFIFYVSAEKKFHLQEQLKKLDGYVINFHFENNGVESWAIK
jgi:D-glycero-alpha-D-manno-heptose-7-phosphate kinase